MGKYAAYRVDVRVSVDLTDIDKDELRTFVLNEMEDEVLVWVAQNKEPEDVFDEDIIAEWAYNHGFKHKDDI